MGVTSTRLPGAGQANKATSYRLVSMASNLGAMDISADGHWLFDIQGALTATGTVLISFIFPNLPATLIVDNKTTGGYALNGSYSGGSVKFPAGTSMWYWNGTTLEQVGINTSSELYSVAMTANAGALGVVDSTRNAIVEITGTNTAQGNITASLSGSGSFLVAFDNATNYANTINGNALWLVPVGRTIWYYNATLGQFEQINYSMAQVDTLLALKASLASPALTGTPTVPTAAADTNSTQVASTAFVLGQLGSASPLMAGTATPGTSLRISHQDHVHPVDTSRAPKAVAGTWTPVITFDAPGDLTVAYGVQYGSYTEHEDAVICHCRLTFTPIYTTAAGNLRISGFPFIFPASGYNYIATGISARSSLNGVSGLVAIGGVAADTYANLFSGGSAPLTTAVAPSGSARIIDFSITYKKG